MEFYTTDVAKRFTIPDIIQIKNNYLNQIYKLDKLDTDINKNLQQINSYRPYRLNFDYYNSKEKPEVGYIDRACWSYLVRLFELHKYMLGTDYDKMQKDIENFKFPDFTLENAEGWILGLKDVIYDNVKTLIKTVFKKLTEDTYYTGSGYSSRKKKKRNNNGVDKRFIISTNDYSAIFGYNWYRPTITDDLEKVSYLLDGKKLPELTLKQKMKQDKKSEYANEYFKIKIYENDNTHYTLTDDLRDKLNLYGPEGAIIGENIKIKIFDKNYF
jgi:hypothetical protein